MCIRLSRSLFLYIPYNHVVKMTKGNHHVENYLAPTLPFSSVDWLTSQTKAT